MTGYRPSGSVSAEDERDLVSELAEAALERAAPEELVIFTDTADEFFRDPEAVLDPKRRDEAVGFGLDLALVTPYVLAVAVPVVRFLLDAAGEVVQEEAKSSIAGVVRRLIRRDKGSPAAAGAAPPLSGAQLATVRELAYSRARAAGVAEGQAALIADSVVGALVAT
jgi:hypothetical protein